MDCETCKEKRKVISQTPKDVPYIVHEGDVARLERVIKRMWKNRTRSILIPQRRNKSKPQ